MTAPLENTATTNASGWTWATRLVLAAGLLFLVGHVAELSSRKMYSIDEFQYAHAAWLVAQGQVPYLDFFDHHFPFLYQLLGGIFVFGEPEPIDIAWLRVGMLASVMARPARLPSRSEILPQARTPPRSMTSSSRSTLAESISSGSMERREPFQTRAGPRTISRSAPASELIKKTRAPSTSTGADHGPPSVSSVGAWFRSSWRWRGSKG